MTDRINRRSVPGARHASLTFSVRLESFVPAKTYPATAVKRTHGKRENVILSGGALLNGCLGWGGTLSKPVIRNK